jgi:uncharacterized protein YbjT (DUF2867 family)
MEAPSTRLNPPIVVTGGTGTLGRQVVQRLLAAGRQVRIVARNRPNADSRRAGLEYAVADLSSGEGTHVALSGAETIVHLAGSQKGDEDKARTVVNSAQATGATHVVYISVVGADRIPVESAVDRAMFGYFASKHAAEGVIVGSGVPWTTLRATQFHDLTFKTVQTMARMPVVPVPAGWRFQPIDSGDVAERIAELAVGPPAGLVQDLGGPRIHDMADLVRSYLDAVGKRRRIVRFPLPGAAARAFRDGANLAPDRAVGGRTWEEFLADRLGLRGARRAIAGDSTPA